MKKLQERMVARIEADGGDTSGARGVLAEACAHFSVEDAALLRACLDPDASKRPSANQLLGLLRGAR